MDISRDYQLPVGKTMRFAFNITNGKTLSQKIGRKITVCEIENIRSIILKDSHSFGTTVLKIKYFDAKKGKEKSFMRLEGAPEDADLNRFIKDLKELIPNQEIWNQSQKKTFQRGQKSVYDIQVPLAGYRGAGLPRLAQIWIIYGSLSFMILPLPLLIYMLVNKCFQVETDDKSINIRKIKNKFFYWIDIERVEVKKVDIRIQNAGFTIDELSILPFIIYPKQGRRIRFKMRTLEGKAFIKDLLGKNLLQISN